MTEANQDAKAAGLAEPEPERDPNLVATLSDGTKIKRLVRRQRACNEKNAKKKLCTGHLKRWYFFSDEVKRHCGENAEVYRCAKCKTLYLPDPEEEARTGTLSW